MRNNFTDVLKQNGVSTGAEYATYTDTVYASVFGMRAKELRRMLGLKAGESIRDNLPPAWLATVVMAESFAVEHANLTGTIDIATVRHCATYAKSGLDSFRQGTSPADNGPQETGG
ncbi:hypothetical protein [Thalassoroseus pseudoceratinae]|uniref:hypothetical protein n=1 Tax=Thalassoroseus pseudoceratinae TaxID=2713176 RepID=UPI00142214E2|nr:hypothetical protein [Thalassoroseus pseudoceratinae]